jgi:hypothetical protein
LKSVARTSAVAQFLGDMDGHEGLIQEFLFLTSVTDDVVRLGRAGVAEEVVALLQSPLCPKLQKVSPGHLPS